MATTQLLVVYHTPTLVRRCQMVVELFRHLVVLNNGRHCCSLPYTESHRDHALIATVLQTAQKQRRDILTPFTSVLQLSLNAPLSPTLTETTSAHEMSSCQQ